MKAIHGGKTKSVEAELAMISALNQVLKKLEWHIEKSARQHDYHTLYLLRTIPGVGQILALVILYEIHDIKRFPKVQNFSFYARLVRPSKILFIYRLQLKTAKKSGPNTRSSCAVDWRHLTGSNPI